MPSVFILFTAAAAVAASAAGAAAADVAAVSGISRRATDTDVIDRQATNDQVIVDREFIN